MKKCILLFIIMSLALCGCAAASQESTPTGSAPAETERSALQAVPETTKPSQPISAETEIPITEPPVETESIAYLDIASGSYLEAFEDELTEDYLDYYLFLPENATKEMPLIVFLHGDGEVGKPEILENFGMIQSAREIYGNEFPFIAISPCTRTTSWIKGNIPDTLKGLIDEIVQRFDVDTDHIIITGHSRGSMGVWYMISEYGDYFSAAVPVSCGPDSVLNVENCVKVPTRAVAGTSGESENRYRYAMQNTVASLQKHGGDIEMIILEHMTHGQTSTAAYDEEMFEWMLSQ